MHTNKMSKKIHCFNLHKTIHIIFYVENLIVFVFIKKIIITASQ